MKFKDKFTFCGEPCPFCGSPCTKKHLNDDKIH